jgi:(3S)-malyl-CoA thioesterase
MRNNILLQRGKSELDFAGAAWFHTAQPDSPALTEAFHGSSRAPLPLGPLYPGSKPRALEKAKTLPTDAIIFDLEDAVSAEEKPAARALLAETLAGGGYGAKAQIVRINGFDTAWGAEDLDTIAAITRGDPAAQGQRRRRYRGPGPKRLDAKAETADTTIWAMMETPLGILNAARIAAAPRMAGFVMGTNDLAKELNSRTRGAMTTSLQMCLLAARAHGLVCVDGVYNAFRDEDGLASECAEGRDFGFDGKTLIHPAQIEITNAAFAPSETEIDLARRQIAAYEEALRDGQGVAVVDGKIVENLHVDTARATLAKAKAIASVEAA